MVSVLKGFIRGTVAGAAGTTALNATTYADMVLRGRPASDTPSAVVSALAGKAGVRVPGRRSQRDNRLQGLGALGGALTGVAVGGLAGALRATGVRLPAAVGGPLLGAAVMLATDLPAARLGISDLGSWSTADWVSDAVPHLLYGVTTHATLVATSRAAEQDEGERPGGASPPVTRAALLRAAALGASTGCRSSAAITAIAIASDSRGPGLAGRLAGAPGRIVTGMLAAAELGVDKHPSVPSRTSAAGLVPRIVLSATSAATVARRDGCEAGPPALVAATAAVGTALAGARLRGLAAHRFGSDLPGALLEDGVAALLGWLGARRPAVRLTLLVSPKATAQPMAR